MTLIRILDTVKSTVGWGTAPSSVITSCTLVVIAYFYLYSISSYLHIPIVVFTDGVTYNAHFENTYLVDKNLDGCIIIILFITWLLFSLKNKKIGLITSSVFVGSMIVTLSLNLIFLFNLVIFTTFPLIVFILIFDRGKTKVKSILKYGANSLTLNYFSISVIICSAIGIILASSNLIFSIQPEELFIHNYAYPIYVLFSEVTPIVLFLLLFSFFVKYIIRNVRSKTIRDNRDSKGLANGYRLTVLESSIPIKLKISFLLFFMIIAIILSLIPHNPVTNETDQLVGVDTHNYIEWITKLINSPDISSVIQGVFVTQSGGDRPITLILLLLITHFVSMNDPSVIEFTPFLLGPLLILVVYLFTRELTSNDIISLIAAFLTAVSYQMLIGLYAGVYANWMSLIIGYLSLTFFIKYLKSGFKVYLFIYFALVIMTLLTHVYTWAIFTIITGILLVVLIKINLFERKRVVLLIIALSLSIVFDIARISLTGSSSSGVHDSISVFNFAFSVEKIANMWNNLFYMVQIYVGGIYSNFIIFALGLYWIIRSRLKDFVTIFILVFLSIGIIPILFGNDMIQARTLFEVPFQIPAAIAMFQIMRNVKGGNILVVSICAWMFFIAVRTSFNLYLILPS